MAIAQFVTQSISNLFNGFNPPAASNPEVVASDKKDVLEFVEKMLSGEIHLSGRHRIGDWTILPSEDRMSFFVERPDGRVWSSENNRLLPEVDRAENGPTTSANNSVGERPSQPVGERDASRPAPTSFDSPASRAAGVDRVGPIHDPMEEVIKHFSKPDGVSLELHGSRCSKLRSLAGSLLEKRATLESTRQPQLRMDGGCVVQTDEFGNIYIMTPDGQWFCFDEEQYRFLRSEAPETTEWPQAPTGELS